MLDVPRIPRRPRIEIRKHRRDRFAQHDSAGLLQLRYGTRIAIRNEVFEDGGAHACSQALRIEDVLDSDRHAVERTAKFSTSGFGFALARF